MPRQQAVIITRPTRPAKAAKKAKRRSVSRNLNKLTAGSVLFWVLAGAAITIVALALAVEWEWVENEVVLGLLAVGSIGGAWWLMKRGNTNLGLALTGSALLTSYEFVTQMTSRDAPAGAANDSDRLLSSVSKKVSAQAAERSIHA